MEMVSVVIPTKNRAKTISRAIRSVLSQTYESIELIIVDDNSDDNTSELVFEISDAAAITIRYIKNDQSKGGAAARNIGAESARGKYIAFLDSDDEWLPEHLRSAVAYLTKSNYCACFSNYFLIGGAEPINEYINHFNGSDSLANLLFKKVIDPRTSTFVFKKRYFDNVKFDVDQKKHQDWDLAIRFCKDYKMGCTGKKTVKLHHDADNRMSADLNHEATAYFLEKHLSDVRPVYGITFLVYLSWSTVISEGKNSNYNTYQKNIKKLKLVVNEIEIKDKIKLNILLCPASIVRIIDKFLTIRAKSRLFLTGGYPIINRYKH